MIAGKNVVWERLFKKVPLKEGVDRWQAFELIMIILDHFENIFLSEVKDEKDVDETYSQHYLDKMNNLLNMIRYGIER